MSELQADLEAERAARSKLDDAQEQWTAEREDLLRQLQMERDAVDTANADAAKLQRKIKDLRDELSASELREAEGASKRRLAEADLLESQAREVACHAAPASGPVAGRPAVPSLLTVHAPACVRALVHRSGSGASCNRPSNA